MTRYQDEQIMDTTCTFNRTITSSFDLLRPQHQHQGGDDERQFDPVTSPETDKLVYPVYISWRRAGVHGSFFSELRDVGSNTNQRPFRLTPRAFNLNCRQIHGGLLRLHISRKFMHSDPSVDRCAKRGIHRHITSIGCYR